MVDGQMKTLRSLRLPLQMALAISPLYWLVGVNLVRELDRGALVKVRAIPAAEGSLSSSRRYQSWAGLGGKKPALLAQVEYYLWKALIQVATSAASLQDSLESALGSINGLDWNLVGEDDIQWFTSCTSHPSFRWQSLTIGDISRYRPHFRASSRTVTRHPIIVHSLTAQFHISA
jgi:hypothetical protein